jgi:hypothetical protein
LKHLIVKVRNGMYEWLLVAEVRWPLFPWVVRQDEVYGRLAITGGERPSIRRDYREVLREVAVLLEPIAMVAPVVQEQGTFWAREEVRILLEDIYRAMHASAEIQAPRPVEVRNHAILGAT